MRYALPSVLLFFTAALLLISCASSRDVEVDGELLKWHPVTIKIQGPQSDELAEVNPFLDYRLDVTFSQADRSFIVPGYYAADGNAAETSATGGGIWNAHFTPDATGEWSFQVSFKTADGIAVSPETEGAPAAGNADGATGVFTINESDKTLPDNRAKGRLQFVGRHYLQWAETKDYFIKVGVDAPENLLAFSDFDATPNVFDLRKTWEPHAQDVPADAAKYTWQNGKGENLLGAVHYLSEQGLNVFSFLTFNPDGDDRNILPHLLKVPSEEYEAYANVKKNKQAWESMFHRTRFDVSKLAQWERIFSYAETQGMFLHFKTHETETDHLMDKGVFGTEGKLYYRELVARFGHHLALNWNIGEENNQPIEEVRKVAEYLKVIDPYQHHRVVHTFPNKDARYAELIGNQSVLTGASLQLSDSLFRDVHPRVLKWRHKSDSTGKVWALAVDEPGRANIALLPDDEDSTHNEARMNALWGTLLAGGYGVEWYFGYASPNSDLTCEDFRSRANFWPQNVHAKSFFKDHLTFEEMGPLNEQTAKEDTYCFGKPNDTYVILKRPKARIALDLSAATGSFNVSWFDPRNGGALQVGSVQQVTGGSIVELGIAPNTNDRDWICLVSRG